jgi:hypothetical protein
VARVDIRDVAQSDCDAIAENMRLPDIEECLALGFTPIDALHASVISSLSTRTATLDGYPVAIFGISVDEDSRVGSPWMLGTSAFDRHGMKLVKFSRDWVRGMIGLFDTLENYVHAENTRSIRYLKLIGFTVEEPTPYGVYDKPFCRFYMENKRCA